MLEKRAIGLIRIYQTYLRIMLPSTCCFSPSCSEYAKQAILKYGLFQGAFKAGRRLLRCHPFSRKPNFDPLV